MIGTKDQLEKVRVSFQESVFGPEEHHLYIVRPRSPVTLSSADYKIPFCLQDDEIGETKKAEGYRVDFTAERGFLAYKGINGPFFAAILSGWGAVCGLTRSE